MSKLKRYLEDLPRFRREELSVDRWGQVEKLAEEFDVQADEVRSTLRGIERSERATGQNVLREWRSAILTHPDLSATEKVAALRVECFVNVSHGYCWPPQARLAKDLGYSRGPNLGKALKRSFEIGALSPIPVKNLPAVLRETAVNLSRRSLKGIAYRLNPVEYWTAEAAAFSRLQDSNMFRGGTLEGSMTHHLNYEDNHQLASPDSLSSYSGDSISTTEYGGPLPGRKRNCVLCRYLISGPAWGNEVFLHGLKLKSDAEDAFERMDSVQREIDRITLDYNQEVISLARFKKERDKRYLQIKSLQAELQLLEEARVRSDVLLGACKQILSAGSASDAGSSLIAADRAGASMLFMEGRLRTKFFLTRFSRVYTILKDERTEAEVESYLREVAFNNELRPDFIINSLSAAEQKRSAELYLDALAFGLSEVELEQVVLERRRLSAFSAGRKILKVVNAVLNDPVPLEHQTSLQLSAR